MHRYSSLESLHEEILFDIHNMDYRLQQDAQQHFSSHQLHRNDGSAELLWRLLGVYANLNSLQ